MSDRTQVTDPAPVSESTQPFTPEFTGALRIPTTIDAAVHPGEAGHVHATPVAIPSVDQFVGRWRFIGVVAAIWIVGAAAGAGLYYWWFHSLDKAVPVFAVLVFVVACIVGSLLTAMVQGRPAVAAMAVSLMSAPWAAALGAGVLYACYAMSWLTP